MDSVRVPKVSCSEGAVAKESRHIMAIWEEFLWWFRTTGSKLFKRPDSKYFLKGFINFHWNILALQYCVNSTGQQSESAIYLHM